MINRRVKVKALMTGLQVALLVLTASSASQAGPLGVNITGTPDITAQFITSTYNATTGAFAANGWAMTLDTGTKTTITTNFLLQATINSATGLASVGTLVIGGAGAPLLKSVNLIGFAFDAVRGGAMEFLFGAPTGSYIVNGPFSATEPVDVLLMAGTGFTGNFATFVSSTSGTADVREDPVVGNPEPSALLLMLVGVAGLGWYRKRLTGALRPC